jgi:ankyrin repeat protein
MLNIVKLILEKKPSSFHQLGPHGGHLLHSASSSGNVELIKFILEKEPASIKFTNRYGITPFHVAAFNTHTETLKELVRHYPEGIQTQDRDGDTTIQRAMIRDYPDGLRFLLDTWPDGARQANHNGDTPLHLGAGYGSAASIKVLLSRLHKVEDLTRRNHDKKTPIDLAQESTHLEISDIIREAINRLKTLEAVRKASRRQSGKSGGKPIDSDNSLSL